MAIGSDPELGVQFTTWGNMSPESQAAWFVHIRETWNGNILSGYATLHYAPRGAENPYANV